MIDPPPRQSIYKPDMNFDFGFGRMPKVTMINGVENKTINAANPGFHTVHELSLLKRHNDELEKVIIAQNEKFGELQKQHGLLEDQLKAIDKVLRTFLTEEQIKLLKEDRVSNYGNDTIIKALKCI
ncbi:hypothetical protein NQ314_012919 [Rhamnusium bicolor]|uniref:Uncharacterized protein n=1 Tax=Rhamnusium bicolor TaxID=1586634 RepID=A0AAV8X9N4_9CUCU|nr:hypothetical protein NQ314_012919 [Rhamnusium bicolor]